MIPVEWLVFGRFEGWWNAVVAVLGLRPARYGNSVIGRQAGSWSRRESTMRLSRLDGLID